MKRPLIIIFSVLAVIAVIGISLMGLFAPKVGNTFSYTSRQLGYGGGGGGEPQMDYMFSAEAPMPASAPLAYDASGNALSNAPDAYAQQVERKVIKDASLSIVVKDPAESMKSITAQAESLGGYVISSSISQNNYGPNNVSLPVGSVSIRVPADKLNDVLEQIKKDAIEVTSENVSGQDVTDQYVDLQSRLTAKQAAEKKLLEILDKAEKTEDVLAVYQQLQQVQSDIEVLKGQIKFIDQSAAMSSVSVYLVAEASVQPIQVGGWKIQGTAKEAIEGLVVFLQGFVRFLIRFFLNYVWQILLVVLPLYGAFIGGRALYRRFAKPTVKSEATEEKK